MVVWIVIGLIAGFIADKFSGGRAVAKNIGVGIVGAIVGGWLIFGHTGTGLNFYSVFGSVAGSVVALVIYKAFGKKP